MTEETKAGAWSSYGTEQMAVEQFIRTRMGDAAFENIDERTFRIVEEAIKLYQCNAAMSEPTMRARLHKLVDVLVDSPPGRPEIELGGLQMAILAYAGATNMRLDALTARVIDSAYAIPEAAWQAKASLRADQGLGHFSRT